MPTTRSRQTPARRTPMRRQPQPRRFGTVGRTATRSAGTGRKRGRQSSGLTGMLSSAVPALLRGGKSAGRTPGRKQSAGRTPGKKGLFALVTAGAGAVAFARKRNKQQDAPSHDVAPPA